jgi:hypothetical protein
MHTKVFHDADELRAFLQLYSLKTYNNAVFEKYTMEKENYIDKNQHNVSRHAREKCLTFTISQTFFSDTLK